MVGMNVSGFELQGHMDKAPSKRLQGKVALVTGSGRGIGKAIALGYAAEGADVVLCARTRPEMETVAAEVRAAGGHALTVQADVSRLDEVEAVVSAALAEFGRVDILVNNAGVQSPIGLLWENSPDEWLMCVLINLGSVFLCCHAVVPAMIRQGGGKVINLSGGGSASPRPRFSAYAASKAAVVRLTETLAEELRDYNIQVNAIAPGAVHTRMTEEVVAAGERGGVVELGKARRVSAEANSPKAAVALAVFLASAESDGLTGRLISAVWDDWASFPERMDRIIASDLYTLRRVTEERRP